MGSANQEPAIRGCMHRRARLRFFYVPGRGRPTGSFLACTHLLLNLGTPNDNAPREMPPVSQLSALLTPNLMKFVCSTSNLVPIHGISTVPAMCSLVVWAVFGLVALKATRNACSAAHHPCSTGLAGTSWEAHSRRERHIRPAGNAQGRAL